MVQPSPIPSGHVVASPGPRVAGRATVLAVRGVSATANGSSVLDDVNFDLREGEVLGLAGAPDSGVEALMPELSAQRGVIEVDGDPDGCIPATPDPVSAVVTDLSGESTNAVAASIARLRRFAEESGIAVMIVGSAAVARSTDLDTLQIILAGRTVERGPAVSVRGRPLHRYSEALLRGGVTSGRPPGSPALGCAFAPVCEFGASGPCQTALPTGASVASNAGAVTVKCHHRLTG